MMNNTVLWPDLTRFGAALHVVTNPTVGVKFLKLAIFDRDVFESESGHSPDTNLQQLLRDCGYTQSATELRTRIIDVYEKAQADKLGLADEEGLLKLERRKLYFYSTHVTLSKQLLKQIVPAIADSDFKQTVVSDISQPDYRYLSGDLASQFIKQHQDFGNNKAGIFYTINSDRDWLNAISGLKLTVNEVLDFNDLPPSLRGRLEGDKRFEALLQFSSLPEIEKVMIGQTLMSNGLPLRGPRLSATIVCYSNREDAWKANSGSDVGLEEVHLPYGLPIAFDYAARRLLVIKDGRFLEVPNRLSIIDDAKISNNARRHFEFIDAAKRMEEVFLKERETGIFDVQAWTDRKAFDQASVVIQEFVELTLAAGSVIYPYTDTALNSSMLVRRSGLRHNVVEKVFTQGFLSFLDHFQETIKPTYDRLNAEYTAADVLKKSVAKTNKILKDNNDPKPPGERRDAGVKIGGARKDYAIRCLSTKEVDELTERELGTVVCKDNIWPRIDYKKLRDEGVDPVVAWVIGEARKNLPVNPLKGGYNLSRRSLKARENEGLNREQCVNYISIINLVKDAFMACKKVDDLVHAAFKIRSEAKLPIKTETGYLDDERYYPDSFVEAVGTRFKIWLPEVKLNEETKSITTTGFSRSLYVAKAKTEGKWDWAIKETVADNPEKKDKIEKPEPVFPHLEKIERVGRPYRTGDIDESMMMSVFGFRSIEYGNWIPQGERQEVLNHTFDAFMDLTSSLGLPPEAASLGGDLAIAFGSRGRGGKRAAMAHYEPGRNVINLTRLSGAGKLAHEWGHAFDYWLSKTLNISSVEPLTQHSYRRQFLGSKLVADFGEIITTASSRTMTKADFVEMSLEATGKGAEPGETVSSNAERLLRVWARRVANFADTESSGAVREYLLGLIDKGFINCDGEIGEFGAKTFDKSLELSKSAFTALRLRGVSMDRLSEKKDYIDYADRLIMWLDMRINNARENLADFVEGPQKIDSKFVKDAKYYDGFRTKPYWSTKVELFARAFESYIQTVVEEGGLSQYLVYGTEYGSNSEISIYPVGEERRLTNAAFDAFFKTHRLELMRLLQLMEPEKKPSEALTM